MNANSISIGELRYASHRVKTWCRKALPISEQALVALDRIFEEARYSSHRLGDGHRQNAQHALSMVLQEIDDLQEVPERDSYDLAEAAA